MRILITGSGGRLGHLLRAARARDGSGDADILFQSRRPETDIEWSPGTPMTALPACDVVIALWGVTQGKPETLTQNAALVDQSMAVAVACKARALFHLSSAAVYGPGANLNERSPPRPINAYGVAKLEMEARIAARPCAAFHQMSLRLANVVGADSLASALRRPEPATLDQFDDGQGPLRSYIGASDLLAVFCALAASPVTDLPGVLNIAAPSPIAMEDLLRAAGKDVVWRPAPAASTQQVTLDVSCMTRLLPHTRIRTAAADLIADWQQLETSG